MKRVPLAATTGHTDSCFHHESWKELINDEEHGGPLIPIMILAHEHDRIQGRRSPNSHTDAILEKFLLDHPTVERPKK
jgi:hypothetical protein